MAALRWLTAGHSYEIIGLDVLGAYDRTMKAAANAGRGLARLLTSAPSDSERTRWGQPCLLSDEDRCGHSHLRGTGALAPPIQRSRLPAGR